MGLPFEDIVKPILQKVGKELGRNSPGILTALGVIGLIGTAYSAAKAGMLAQKIIDGEAEQRYELAKISGDPDEPISNVDIVKLTWQVYGAPTALGIMSIGCILGSHYISTGRTAVMAAAYAVTEKSLGKLEEAVERKYGKDEARSIRDEIGETSITKNEPSMIVLASQDTLFYDVFSDRYFTGDIEKIRQMVNQFDHDLLMTINGYMTLNEFYARIGLPPIHPGSNIGWEPGYALVELEFTPKLINESKACIAINFKKRPILLT